MADKMDWQKLAEKELRGKPLGDLEKTSGGGLKIKPLYTADDLEGIEHLDSVPGVVPYVRGPRATMYAGRPWTIRQYAGSTCTTNKTPIKFTWVMVSSASLL